MGKILEKLNRTNSTEREKRFVIKYKTDAVDARKELNNGRPVRNQDGNDSPSDEAQHVIMKQGDTENVQTKKKVDGKHIRV